MTPEYFTAHAVPLTGAIDGKPVNLAVDYPSQRNWDMMGWSYDAIVGVVVGQEAVQVHLCITAVVRDARGATKQEAK